MLLSCCLLAGLPTFADETGVVEQVRKLGGKAERDDALPGKPVVKVNLQATNAKDADLAGLKDLKSLKTLYLGYGTQTTDVGLAKLKTLTTLEELYLPETQITDAGIPALKSLINLRKLGLQSCKGITDKSVPSLMALKRLTDLSVYETRITESGVAQLQKALPGATIGGGTANPPATTAAEREKKLKVQESGVSAEMIRFMSLLDGTEDGTKAAVQRYIVPNPNNYDLTAIRLESPHVTKTTRMGNQVCYTMQTKQGQAKSVYELCWEKGKVQSVRQISLSFD